MFKEAIQKTTEIKDALKPGLQALGANSQKVRLGDSRLCQGSVDLDNHLKDQYPNDNRWDYVFGYSDQAYFVEVHPAHTSEVRTVIQKLQWLRFWINSKAPELHVMKKRYSWIATNGTHILKDSKEARMLAENGLSLPRNRVNV